MKERGGLVAGKKYKARAAFGSYGQRAVFNADAFRCAWNYSHTSPCDVKYSETNSQA